MGTEGMRTVTGNKLAAVWRYPLTDFKVAAYKRDNIPEILEQTFGPYLDLTTRIKLWTRVSGLWAEKEGVIE